MTSVIPMLLKQRPDVVTDGGIADDVVANAPAREDHSSSCPRWWSEASPARLGLPSRRRRASGTT